ncbi:hypothetical protein JCM1841_005134 [Sporobolomyces salmonicolor]
MAVETYRSLGTYVHRKAAAAQNSPEQQTAWMSDAQLLGILVILLSVFGPPLAVFLERRCGSDLLLNLLLSCFGYLPGRFMLCTLLILRRSVLHPLHYLVLKYGSPLVYHTADVPPPSDRLTWHVLVRAASDDERAAKRARPRRTAEIDAEGPSSSSGSEGEQDGGREAGPTRVSSDPTTDRTTSPPPRRRT